MAQLSFRFWLLKVRLIFAYESHLEFLNSFRLPTGFQNFVFINKIHPLKKRKSHSSRYTSRRIQKHFIRQALPRDAPDCLLVKGKEITWDRSYSDRPWQELPLFTETSQIVKDYRVFLVEVGRHRFDLHCRKSRLLLFSLPMANVHWFYVFIKTLVDNLYVCFKQRI